MALGIAWPAETFGCGPCFQDERFTYEYRSEVPASDYIRGNLQVIAPSYYSRFLVVAFRYLNGDPLTENERKLAERVFEARMTAGRPFVGEDFRDERISEWRSAREAVSGVRPWTAPDTARSNEDLFILSYENCLPGAFEYAAETLRARVKELGADSAEVREWVEAQDRVFDQCGTGGEDVPHPLSAGGSPAERRAARDRLYQVAAAHLYRGEYDKAESGFRAILDDAASPHVAAARISLGRVMLRRAFLPTGMWSRAMLRDAHEYLGGLRGLAGMEKYQESIQRLVNFAAYRIAPDAYFAAVADRLAKPAASAAFAEELIDFGRPGYVAHVDGDAPTPQPEGPPTAELMDWISAIRSGDEHESMFRTDPREEARAKSLERFRATKSSAWLLAALVASLPTDGIEADLQTAVSGLSSSDPGFLSAMYYARKCGYEVDVEAILKRPGITEATRNRFLELALAKDPSRLSEFGPRRPIGVNDPCEPAGDIHEVDSEEPLPLRFDADGARAANSLRPHELLALARTPSVGDFLRERLTTMAWVRALLLDLEEVFMEANSELAALHADHASELGALEKSPAWATRKRAAILLLMRYPSMTRDLWPGELVTDMREDERTSYQKNWWCRARESDLPKGLRETDMAPKFFLKLVQAWTEKEPNDPLLPEALALAVKSSRWGCCDEETQKLAGAAFRLLHRRYGATSHAKSTPTYAACEIPVEPGRDW